VHRIGLLLFFVVACFDLARIRRWREAGVLERLLITSIVVLVCLASTVPIAVENARYRIPLLPLMWGMVVATVASYLTRRDFAAAPVSDGAHTAKGSSYPEAQS
jgi:hypothetical protein